MISVELKAKPKIKRWLRDNEIDVNVVEKCLNIILNQIRSWKNNSYKDIEIKKELIDSIQSILNANKDNDYCCQYQLSDMIKEKMKQYEIH